MARKKFFLRFIVPLMVIVVAGGIATLVVYRVVSSIKEPPSARRAQCSANWSLPSGPDNWEEIAQLNVSRKGEIESVPPGFELGSNGAVVAVPEALVELGEKPVEFSIRIQKSDAGDGLQVSNLAPQEHVAFTYIPGEYSSQVCRDVLGPGETTTYVGNHRLVFYIPRNP